MGGALVIAILVAVMVQATLSPKKSNDAVVQGIEVLVASRDLATGETLKAKDVHWEAFPEKALFRGTIKRKEQADENKLEVYDKPLRRNIESGEPITTQSVIIDVEGGGNFLSARIKPGMRAMGILVKAESSVGGFIAPGDYVDIIVSYQIRIKGEPATYADKAVQRFGSETILSNIRVLAVDQTSKEDSRDAKVAKTITIEVSKEDAQKLTLATMMGTITLALRRLGEKDTEDDKKVPLTTDVVSSRIIREIYGIMDESKGSSHAIRLYSGDAVVNVPVRQAP